MKLVGKSIRIRTDPTFLLRRAGYKKIANGWMKQFRSENDLYRYHAILLPSGKLQIHTDLYKTNGRGYKYHVASKFTVITELTTISILDKKLTPPLPSEGRRYKDKTVEMTPEMRDLIRQIGIRNSAA